MSRFIPAGAGNTWASVFSGLGPAVYPRWRGEHSTVSSSLASNSGLSPLARGTPENAWNPV
ncbi:hypothetical protein FORC79_3722 [Salmonella enterica subsp. enterica serovar Typhimurium]|nr:hypothetical protein SEETMRM10607_15825 [Salmonella enterica subsp. enterica serovar Typhimurium]AZU09139.1 hypothetical protein FORC79_3722 [Salmonella enterica subsp. enterica serovar Typhimurium]